MKGIFILGPSGAGKSTIAKQLKEIYDDIFNKQFVVSINLDCANNHLNQSQIDINELITIDDIMQQYQLGPNGALLYAMRFLHQNIEWLLEKLKKYKSNCTYLIFDLPGQIQLYINDDSLKSIISKIIKEINLHACALEIFDSTFIYDINQFVSLCMMSLATLIHMEMPHINIMNKVDVLKGQRPAGGMLNDYFSLISMTELLQNLTDKKQPQTPQLLAKIIDSFGQVSFIPYSAHKPNLIGFILYDLERVFGTLEPSLLNPKFLEVVSDAKQQFSKQKLLTSLQNQLFEEQQQDYEKIMKEIQNSKNESK